MSELSSGGQLSSSCGNPCGLGEAACLLRRAPAAAALPVAALPVGALPVGALPVALLRREPRLAGHSVTTGPSGTAAPSAMASCCTAASSLSSTWHMGGHMGHMDMGHMDMGHMGQGALGKWHMGPGTWTCASAWHMHLGMAMSTARGHGARAPFVSRG